MVSQEIIYETVFKLCSNEQDISKIDELLKLLEKETPKFDLKNINVAGSFFHFIPSHNLLVKYFIDKEMSDKFLRSFSYYTRRNLLERKGVVYNADKTKFVIDDQIRVSYQSRQNMNDLKFKLKKVETLKTELQNKLNNKTNELRDKESELQGLKTINEGLIFDVKKRKVENDTLEKSIKKVKLELKEKEKLLKEKEEELNVVKSKKQEEDIDFVTLNQELRAEKTKYYDVQTRISECRLSKIEDTKKYKKEIDDLKTQVDTLLRNNINSPTSYQQQSGFFPYIPPPPPLPPISSQVFTFPGSVLPGVLWLLNHSNTRYEIVEKKLKIYLHNENVETIESIKTRVFEENEIGYTQYSMGLVTDHEFDDLEMESLLFKIFCYTPHKIERISQLADTDVVAILYWLTN